MWQSELIQLLTELIAEASITPNPLRCYDIVRKFLPQFTWQEDEQLGTLFGNFKLNPANESNLLKDDNSSKHFLFVGHVDVVPVNVEEWLSDPFTLTLQEAYAYGRGVADMKGSIAAMLVAIKQLLQNFDKINGLLSNLPDALQVSVLLTSDEEADGLGAKAITPVLIRKYHFDYALVGEPSCTATLGDGIRIGRRGSLHGTITVREPARHVAYVSEPGIFLKVAQIIDKLCAHRFPAPTNLCITSVTSNSNASNVTSSEVVLKLNVRFHDSAEAIQEVITNILRDIDANIAAHFKVTALPYLNSSAEWQELVSKVINDNLDVQPHLNSLGGTSDARFLAKYVPILEFGLVNSTIHASNECVLMTDLFRLSEVYYQIMLQIFKPTDSSIR